MTKLTFFCLIPVLIAVACQRQPESLVPEGYESWKSTTNAELNYPIPGHEEHYRRIFINNIGENVQTELQGSRVFHDYPDGTVILKEVFGSLDPAPGENPVALTVMIKQPDNPMARAGWIWVRKDLTTGTEEIIQYEFCFDCHGNANESHPYGDRNPNQEYRDYVFFPYSPE